MKTLISFLVVASLLTGCASMEEAYRLDREFGQATQASFEKMISHPDHRYASQTPEGLAGIHAEGMMKAYDDSYKVKAKTEDIIQIGLQSKGK